MLEIGKVYFGNITQVQPYGLFVCCEEERVFVPLDQLSWRPNPMMLDRYSVGDQIKVRVERRNIEQSTFSASVRAVSPEDNPYLMFSNASGQVFNGHVHRRYANGVVIKMENGCTGEIEPEQGADSLKVGAAVRVIVDTVNVEETRLRLRLAKEGNGAGAA